MIVFSLTLGQECIIDDCDAWVMKHRWWAHKEGDVYYVVGHVAGKQVRLHRLLLEAKPGESIDHINHNGCDNRRGNIRICTVAENVRNQRVQKFPFKSSRFKGVCYVRTRNLAKPWQAQIKVDRTFIYLGHFKDEMSAALVYNYAAIRYFGEFAHLNTIREEIHGNGISDRDSGDRAGDKVEAIT